MMKALGLDVFARDQVARITYHHQCCLCLLSFLLNSRYSAGPWRLVAAAGLPGAATATELRTSFLQQAVRVRCADYTTTKRTVG
jgi:hypothetical protein